MLRNATDFVRDRAPFFIVPVVVVVILLALYGAALGVASMKESCAAAGGELHSQTSGGYGYSASGDYVYTTNTTYTCLTSDGRIIMDY